MGVEIIKNVVCDRCGRKCSSVREKIIHQDTTEQYDLKIKQFSYNVFSYSELVLVGFDNRFPERKEVKTILCGACVSSLSDWLKNSQ